LGGGIALAAVLLMAWRWAPVAAEVRIDITPAGGASGSIAKRSRAGDRTRGAERAGDEVLASDLDQSAVFT